MVEIDVMRKELQQQFGIPGALSVEIGHGDLPKFVLTHRAGARAEIYLHGAHVSSWTDAGGHELLFMSRKSHFAPEKPIRGGIPVIFPQFGGGPLPQHGFARISDWTPAWTGQREDGTVAAALQLTDSPATQAMWPYPFRLELTVLLSANKLTINFQATNTGEKLFPFYAALHTYFGVTDIYHTAVHGLDGVTFIDSMQDDAQDVETREAIRFLEETDRIYVNGPETVRLEDEDQRRSIIIAKKHMADYVVWNPWVAKAQRMADFGDREWQRMVCVETGNIAAPRELLPGRTWQGETVLTVRG